MNAKQTSSRRQGGKKTKTQTSLGLVVERSISDLKPSPENNLIYNPLKPDSPGMPGLMASIEARGVEEELLISLDDYVISGHRRLFASNQVGLEKVPVRVKPIRRADYTANEWVRLLREHNHQRDKTFDEKLREELVTTSPDVAHIELIAHRRKRGEVGAEAIELREVKKRHRFSAAKRPFADEVCRVVYDLKNFWPLSDRRIHYVLLNDPPLRNAKRPNSVYQNDKKSYGDLCEVLTRLRVFGEIPMSAIDDETRPETHYAVWPDVRHFMREQLDNLFENYWRDYMVSQPNHLEIICEKNTVYPVIKAVAHDYCIPVTSGRGFGSLPPRHKMATRFKKSGKQTFVLLIISDHDADGEEIAHSFARSMRDDFGVDVHAVKVALTREQVNQYKLPKNQEAKKKSPNYKRFVAKYGKDTYEVEALPPETLQNVLRASIDNVIDCKAFNHELDTEKRESAQLAATKRIALEALSGVDLEIE